MIFPISPALARSFIEIIKSDPVEPLVTVQDVDLTYNDLETLTSDLKVVFPHVKTVSLDGNSWICDKVIFFSQRIIGKKWK